MNPHPSQPIAIAKYSLAGIALVVIGFLFWLFRPGIEGAEADPRERQPAVAAVTSVAAVRVTRSDLSLRAEATGHLQPWRQVEISSETHGKVTLRDVQEGQWVGTGSLLLELDDRDRQIELAEAEAELLKVKADHAVFVDSDFASTHTPDKDRQTDFSLVESEYQKAKRLFEQGMIAEKALHHARRKMDQASILAGRRKSEVQAATTGLAQAEQRLARARLAVERTRIQAPFSGRVSDIEIEAGQQISTGQRCFLLLDESRVTVDVDVLEADLVWLRSGAPAWVRIPALENRVFTGTVHTKNPRVSPETGTGRVTVVIDNPDGDLMPGLFAFVELETRNLPQRLTVPAEAHLVRQSKDLVFRLDEGHALWTYVETGARSGGLIEITNGLAEGDLVAIDGHFALAHEAPVTLAIDGEGALRQQEQAGSAP